MGPISFFYFVRFTHRDIFYSTAARYGEMTDNARVSGCNPWKAVDVVISSKLIGLYYKRAMLFGLGATLLSLLAFLIDGVCIYINIAPVGHVLAIFFPMCTGKGLSPMYWILISLFSIFLSAFTVLLSLFNDCLIATLFLVGCVVACELGVCFYLNKIDPSLVGKLKGCYKESACGLNEARYANQPSQHPQSPNQQSIAPNATYRTNVTQSPGVPPVVQHDTYRSAATQMQPASPVTQNYGTARSTGTQQYETYRTNLANQQPTGGSGAGESTV